MDNKRILTIIGERIDICDHSFELSKQEKWIHIGIVLRGLYKEISGIEFEDVKSKDSEVKE